MKIGVDATPLCAQLTGVGNYLFYLLEELVQLRPHDHFYLYAIRKSEHLETFASFSNVTVRYAPFLGFSEALWSQTTLPYHCRRDAIDLFWGVTQSVPLLGKYQRLLTVHDFAYHLFPKTVSKGRGTYLRLFAQRLYTKADALIAISHGTARRLTELYGLKASTVIQPPLRNMKVEEIKVRREDYYVVVGTLEPRKNLVPFIEAYEGKLPLVVVGAKGWGEVNIPEGVEVLGYVADEEVNALIKHAQALIMPSLYEGYGMPLKEARSLGTPVICSDVPEMLEAAEGDASILGKGVFEREVRMNKVPSYPSNRELATLLSKAMTTLLEQSADRG